MRSADTEALLTKVRQAVAEARRAGVTVEACLWDATVAAVDQDPDGVASLETRKVAERVAAAAAESRQAAAPPTDAEELRELDARAGAERELQQQRRRAGEAEARVERARDALERALQQWRPEREYNAARAARTGNAVNDALASAYGDVVVTAAQILGLLGGPEPRPTPSRCWSDGDRCPDHGAEQLRRQRDGWEADARRYAQNADYWRGRADAAEQVDALRERLMREALGSVAARLEAAAEGRAVLVGLAAELRTLAAMLALRDGADDAGVLVCGRGGPEPGGPARPGGEAPAR